ncbi:protein argonaute 4A [Citrus sinensis]|uniref:Protein argonaute 4A n=1 Tax=Citrus sinensis TaxID=2711 RepID=A0ACB8K3Q2_CITSI|nr:protein argonaute 4A [Citrus sinensis]
MKFPKDSEAHGPSPSEIPPNVESSQIKSVTGPEMTKKISKPSGSKGEITSLLSNHFKVSITGASGHIFHYSAALFYEDGCPVETKGIRRKIIDKVCETNSADLAEKDIAYDGEKSLFTIGALPHKKNGIILSRTTSNDSPDGHGSNNERDKKRRRVSQSKTFKVEISFPAKIPLPAIAAALHGQESQNSREAFRVLDIILRQHAAKQGCFLVRQSFFQNEPRSFFDLGGGVLGPWLLGLPLKFSSHTRRTLMTDGSTTSIIKPGPLVDFLIANQNVHDCYQLHWAKAKRTLKNLRIRVHPFNREYRITGLSDSTCKRQMFSWKSGVKDRNGDVKCVDVTVFDYFVNHGRINLCFSGDFPCIDVGKPRKPTYIPIEPCSLLSLQRYTKALTVFQRSALVEKSQQKPQEKMKIITDVMRSNKYDSEPMLRSCAISINSRFAKVEGRILSAPRVKQGAYHPKNGRWSFHNKIFVQAAKIDHWAVVNFSARYDIRSLCRDLIRFGEMKGIVTPVRADRMFVQMKQKFEKCPCFLLCLLPDKKDSDLYGSWKRKTLSEFGIFNQCLAPTKVNEHDLMNVLLKINANCQRELTDPLILLGGLNSLLAIEQSKNLPLVSKVPTIIFGMDVSHGSPGHSNVPSVATVGCNSFSRNWPILSRYRASVRSQSAKLEMTDSLFKPLPNKDDAAIVSQTISTSKGTCTPSKRKFENTNMYIYKDGVSESQFNQVLNIELEQIIEACKYLDASWSPKFTVIVAQKRNRTESVCHPTNYDFYMCAHAAMIGTTRQTHYHVLLDQIGFSVDDLQELVHSLCCVYQRSTTAVSVASTIIFALAPVRYAHLAAAQFSQFMKFDDLSETSSSPGGQTSSGHAHVPALPKLHENVRRSVFLLKIVILLGNITSG